MFIILMFVIYIPTLLKYQHICWHLPDQRPYYDHPRMIRKFLHLQSKPTQVGLPGSRHTPCDSPRHSPRGTLRDPPRDAPRDPPRGSAWEPSLVQIRRRGGNRSCVTCRWVSMVNTYIYIYYNYTCIYMIIYIYKWNSVEDLCFFFWINVAWLI